MTERKRTVHRYDTINLNSISRLLFLYWPELPVHIKTAIKALIQTQKKGSLLDLQAITNVAEAE